MDNVQKETHVVSVMTDEYKDTCTVVREAKFRAVTKNEKKTSCNFWHPPVCQNFKSET